MIDMRTVILSCTVSNLICLGVMAALWRWNRRRFSGLGFWLVAFLLQFLSLPLFVLRGVVPDFLSMTVSNTMAVGGTLLLYIGLERFTGNRGWQIHNYILLVIFFVAYTYFAVIYPSLAARNLLFSAGLLIIYSQCAWLMLRRVAPGLRSSARSVGYVSIAFCLVSLGRILVTLSVSPGNDFFRSNDYETSILMIYQMLFIILTFSLFLLVNNRLFVDLKEADERYRDFFSHSFEAIYRTEFDRPIDTSLPVETQIDQIYQNAYMAEYNQALADMYDLPARDSMLGVRLLDAHGGADNPTNRAAFRKVIEGGYKSFNDETIEQDARGSPVWFLSNTVGIIENGFLVRLWGTSIDITKRKQAEESLRANEASMRSLIENVKDIFVRYDLNLRYRYVSPVVQKFLDATPESFIGKTHRQAGFSEAQAEFFDAGLRKAIESQKPVDVEFSLQGRGGEYIMQTRVYPEFDEKGEVTSVVTVTSDVTERKRMEEKLREGEERLRLAVSAGRMGIWDRNFITGLLNWSVECKAMFGLPPEVEMNDERFMNALHPDDRLPTDIAIREAQAKRTDFNTEYRVIWPDGTLHWIAALGRWYYDKAGQAIRMAGVTLDITERKRAETALMQAKRYAEESEARFRQLLEFSPVPIAVADGENRLILLNKQFVDTYGYTLQDIQTIDQWSAAAYPDDEYRAIVLKQWGVDVEYAVKNNAPTPIREYQVVCKTGEVKTVEISAYFEGGLAIGLFHDISERKFTEGIHQLRLRLWEFSASHSTEEIMQQALDEVGYITGSPIGFFHFVEEDQNMLSLQAWSTRTRTEFCNAKGAGMHYPISEAGVWADCFRQKRPVIHNDYASLPHRKGLPEGHAAVVRELIVPIIRGGRAVSILGIGNKPFDYSERDVELVSYIADIVWTIVEYKQTEEHIRQLNSQLELLAMTDELTGLVNRRSFFLKGDAEIHRALRYATPLSLIMLDIDQFKSANDTYGHAAGDLVLKRIADVFRINIRDVDVLARLGGEEFGILLPNTQSADAAALAERLRLSVERENFEFQGQNISATISVGVAEYRSEMRNLDALLLKADTAMYQAKNEGRNRIVCLD